MARRAGSCRQRTRLRWRRRSSTPSTTPSGRAQWPRGGTTAPKRSSTVRRIMRKCWRCTRRSSHTQGGHPAYRRFGQRLLDCVLTVPALIVFAPVLLVVALLVRRRIGAPVFFRQQRLGKD